MSRVAPSLEMTKLETIFRHKVFKMLLVKGKVTREMIAMLSNWSHSGFQVFCGQRLFPQDETAMINPARYNASCELGGQIINFHGCFPDGWGA
jgi:hypothetical protein